MITPRSNYELKKPEKKYLWKFMDMHKFIAFLNSKELFFGNLIDFEDKLEGCTELTPFLLLKDLYSSGLKDNKLPRQTDGAHTHMQRKAFLNRIVALKQMQKRYYANCFYESNLESKAMWSLFASTDGVALKFASAELWEYIKKYCYINLRDKFFLSSDKIEYRNLLHLGGKEIEELPQQEYFNPYVKDELYSNEKEYRFLLEEWKDNSERPIVKLNEWTDVEFDIYLYSDIEDWKWHSISELTKKYGLIKSLNKSKNITKTQIYTQLLISLMDSKI